MRVCRVCVVAGRVQGVAYRASTQHRARELGITGYAKNLIDGSVEVLACGAQADVAELCKWLWDGPRAAEVTMVRCADVADAQPSGFITL